MIEGKADLEVHKGKISKELPVFFNPIMELNRTLSVLLLQKFPRKEIGLPLAGSGARGIRILKETQKTIVHFNDASAEACEQIQLNLEKNNVSGKVTNLDGNVFLANSKGFDYIDIDPFGSPVKFLSMSIARLARNGILGVTATDTAALCGTYPKACKRKYYAQPKRNYLMHETGLRILIRRVQLEGASHDKALIPLLSYAKDHYMRVFFFCKKGKQEVDKILNEHGYFEEIGPMWLGSLTTTELEHEFAKKLYNEVDTVGFYDLHDIAREKGISIPKTDDVIKQLVKKGIKASRTHFSDYGIKTEIEKEKFIQELFLHQ